LESIRFRREDYSILEKLTGNKDKTDLDGPQKILDRMRRAYIRRARQTDIIKDHISRSPYPVLVCGDFNDTPNSYTYHNISYGLEDAFKNAGYGMGATFVSIIPFLRIDFILYSPETFSPIYFRVLKRSLSDHYPIVSVMRLNSFN
jgi:endonuclease/exonuclease/phosphatase (EEP) superfamily protein YafD